MMILHLITWVGLFIWYVQMRKKEKKKLYQKIFFFAVTGNLIGAIASGAYEYLGRSITEPVLERSALGGQPSLETWIAATEDGERYKLNITVPAVAYSQEEVAEYFSATVRQLDQLLFADTSACFVRENLDLPTSLQDNPVSIQWRSNHPTWVDDRGKLSGEIPEEGGEVVLEADLSLQGQVEQIQRTILVYPPLKSEQEQMEDMIQAEIQKLNADQCSKTYLLPGTAGGKRILWDKKNPYTGIWILTFTLIFAVLFGAQDIQKEVEIRKEREKSLARDYPELILEIVLLLGAGLSMRRIFEKIGRDYRKKKESGLLKECRCGYEEIFLTWQEMENGVSELAAYEHLGERAKLRNYRSFATILRQNLRKGEKGLLELLKKEAQDAQEERRRNARIAGETAGTRLLLPMGMMLVVVLMILLVPAFLSFGA